MGTVFVAGGIFFIWSGIALWAFRGKRRVWMLKNESVNAFLPSLSVILAVRNDAPVIRHALPTLLGQRYLDFEVIVVNDRSTDDTKQILAELASQFPTLRTIEITSLPEGWLGKCHAMHVGAEAARADYLVFVDGDIYFKKDALAKAASLAVRENIDHLAVLPEKLSTGFLNESISVGYFFFIHLFQKLWNINCPKSRAYIGVGAFNLVRRSAYRHISGHRSLRMELVDDFGLAFLLRKAGFNQKVAYGEGEIAFQWIESPWDVFGVLEKNAFASMGFKIHRACAAVLIGFVLCYLPFFGLFLPYQPIVFGFSVASVLLIVVIYGTMGSWFRKRCALLLPLSIGLIGIALVRSAFLCLRHQGVRWRGTHYSLDQLRRGMAYPR